MDSWKTPDLQPTGDLTIDAEHDGILDALNRLIHRDEIALCDLSDLRALLTSHFATEDGAMTVLRADRRQAHQDAHDHFLRTVDALTESVDRGESFGGDRAYPLMLWFIVHSNTADAELAEAERPAPAIPSMIVMKDWLASIGAGDLADGEGSDLGIGFAALAPTPALS